MKHWSDSYAGLPWSFNFDCAALVEKVNHEVFDREVYFPYRYAQDMNILTEQLNEEKDKYAKRVHNPFEGDTLTMSGIEGVEDHCGVYFSINGIAYCLHNCRSVGGSIISAVRDLKRIGFTPEGTYRWK